jgi:type IV secretion system protein TrbJ
MKLTSRVKRIAAVAVLAIVSTPAAFAIFGFGDIVFDPTNFGKLVEQLAQMEQQYSQLVQTYQMVTSQYNQMIWMAKMVPANLRAQYRALITPWRHSSATNTYGTTGGWIAAINSGSGVPAGYQQATQQLADYGAALSNIPGDQLDRVKTTYATVELADGANESAMDLLGRMRANAPQVESAIQSLEDDSLSTDPDLNTEIAVMNKVNAANLVALRNSQDTNKLLVALTEQQIIEAKRKRDAEAAAINSHVRFMAEEQAILRAQAGDPSARMLAYRMP